VLFYLCYLNLELSDFAQCIRYGSDLLQKFGSRLSAKTEFSARQYLAEAYCMQGMSKEALKMLGDAKRPDEPICCSSN
jgi:hypothetical protein